MSREIKFRSFVNNNKCIYFDFGNIRDLNFEEMRGYDIQEYTGLKDKNGKEIYEGDIISHNSKIFVICYSKNLGIVGIMLDKNYHTFIDTVKRNHSFVYFHYIANVSKYLEVIGNIYENPELLKF